MAANKITHTTFKHISPAPNYQHCASASEAGAAIPLASLGEDAEIGDPSLASLGEGGGTAQAVTEGVPEGVPAGELYDEPLPELTDETSALSDETAEEISDEVPEMTDDEKIN